jgi:hypothetical protein
MERWMTSERLRALLHYNPATGVFRWRISIAGPLKAGRIAGTTDKRGRRYIMIDGRKHIASRLAHLWMTGEWPIGMIDHRDGDPLNNRWRNLREATRGQNAQNAKRRRDNTSGFKGVSFSERYGKWRATISRDRQRINLGWFDSPEDAHAAYCDAAREHYGEFAKLQRLPAS